MNILLIIRPELFSIIIMMFLIIYDRYCARFREKKDVFLPLALTCMAHCVFALVTEITVNMESISKQVNDTCHILFFFFSLMYSLSFLGYTVSLVFPRGRQRRTIMIIGSLISLGCVIFMSLSPIEYLQGLGTKYSAGIGPTLCYALGFLFFLSADVLLIICHRRIDREILFNVLPLSFITLGLLFVQIMIPEFLFTAQSLTITAVGLFLAIENPVRKLQKQAFIDAYLNIWNRNSYEYDLEHIIVVKRKLGEDMTYVISDVNGLKAINDNLGHAEGDRLLVAVARNLQDHLKSAYKIYRVGGDEFAAFYFGKDMSAVTAEMKAAAEACNAIRLDQRTTVGISMGYAKAGRGEEFSKIFRRAEAMMYENKRDFYARNGHDRRKN